MEEVLWVKFIAQLEPRVAQRNVSMNNIKCTLEFKTVLAQTSNGVFKTAQTSNDVFKTALNLEDLVSHGT